MDRGWWDLHLAEVNETFKGQRFSNNPLSSRYNVTKLPNDGTFKTYGNSGAAAINLAATSGAKRIIMLGYDVQRTDKKSHWHGDHPRQLGNAGRIENWPKRFQELRDDLSGMDIVNCSRATALTMFPRMDLDEALTT